MCMERLKTARRRVRRNGRLGGVSEQEKKLRRFISKRTGSPGGILLTGPSGSGKTSLVEWVSAEERCLLKSVHCGDLYRSDPKECSRGVADIFREALAHAAEGRTVLLLEDIGAN